MRPNAKSKVKPTEHIYLKGAAPVKYLKHHTNSKSILLRALYKVKYDIHYKIKLNGARNPNIYKAVKA